MNNDTILKLMNIPIWLDWLKEHNNDVTIKVGIWGLNGNKSCPEHGDWSRETWEVLLQRKLGYLPKIEIIYKELNTMQIPKQAQEWIDEGVILVTASWTGVNLDWYATSNPVVQEFLDKVYFINSAGNSGEYAVVHPGLQEPEVLVGAVRYDFMEPKKILWLRYTNQELLADGTRFVEDINAMTNVYLPKFGVEYGGTSCAGQTFGILVAIMICVFKALHDREPRQDEIDGLLLDKFYTEFHEESTNTTKRMARLPKMEEVFMEKKVEVSFVQNSADYKYNGEDRTLLGYDKPNDGLPAPEVPFTMQGGHTMIPLVLVQEILEELGITAEKSWDYDKKMAKLVCSTNIPVI